MKFFHTADWHLGKLVQGMYMTDDQQFVLEQFIKAIEEEKPDAVIIAGDLYDRAIPTTEAVHLLNKLLESIVLELKTPVLAIAGNHDSPSRLDFGSNIMKSTGFHIVGELSSPLEPVVLNDEYGQVYFHLVPYAEPGKIRYILEDDTIKTHDDAMRCIVARITENLDKRARHVFVGHAFVTPHGEPEENTSDSERPLSIGGAEHVNAKHFEPFHYTALGHLHQAHYVGNESIQYAGSPLKYSISEERHQKGYYIVELDQDGHATLEKRLLSPRRDMRTVEGLMADIERHEISEDYVFVRLLDETPVLSAMERIRAVYPNAMHVTRGITHILQSETQSDAGSRAKMDDFSLFQAFYKEVKGIEASSQTEGLFTEVLQEMIRSGGEQSETVKDIDDSVRAL